MDLLGRDDLLATVRAGLSRGRVLLHGPVGIGKSAVLEAVVPADGTVLRSCPAEADRRIPYLVLADLLGDVRVDLPGPQQEALDRALRRGHGEPDPLALRQAVLTVFREVDPVVAVDNGQWVDDATAEVLAYAVARAGARVIVAAREPVAGWCGEVIEVPPLSAAVTAELMARHGQVDVRLTGGNPLYAIELSRSPGGIPARLRQVVAELLDAQPAATRTTLLVASLVEKPTLRMIVHCGRERAAAELGDCPLVRVEPDGGVHFRQPLVAAAIPVVVPADEVRRVHARLAELAADPVERARHRACSVTGFDESTAVLLLRAAGAVRRQGALGRAAELGRLAAECTPPSTPLRAAGRRLRAANDALGAGWHDLATSLAQAVLCSPGVSRTQRVRAQLVMVDAVRYARTAAGGIVGEALTHAKGDAALEAPVEYRFAVHSALGGDLREAARHFADAVLLARTAKDVHTEVMSLCSLALSQIALGDATATATLDLARRIVPDRMAVTHDGTLWVAARLDLFADRLQAASDHLTALLDHAGDRGLLSEVVGMTWAAIEVWVAMGRCGSALRRATECLRLAETMGSDLALACYGAALAEAYGGDPVVADALARRGAGRAESDGDYSFLVRNLHAQGLAALGAGNPEAALGPLRRAGKLELDMGAVDPAVFAVRPDLAETLIAVGELTEAAGVIGGASACAVRLGRRGVAASLDRADGLLRLALKDYRGAERSLGSAVEVHRELRQPLQLGRSLVALGVLERRRKRRGASRRLLEQARQVFTESGAPRWADRVAVLLGDTPDGAALAGFEARIARHVIEGASNPEVAGRLNISVKTVEGALTRIYRKLEVHNRTQLAARLRGDREFPLSDPGIGHSS
ncbi:DNA-binding CsgD family transcriptional regulator [Saccharothrix tamanrassetensis]|uniref:DNA-binding CsgD family transcriptional regulator n=1 Tax=Saccharothrix tamanrassetensis TaxID=1051531 RepID=A0A841CKV6_9PSEU|nr:LuxR family transcriptional regulator [Saccharothrix tamanrassetensis]MBB5958161.1 DNA-binding CsgD family transcriptional regulator [Saccharothrix tamanrassetensis]